MRTSTSSRQARTAAVRPARVFCIGFARLPASKSGASHSTGTFAARSNSNTRTSPSIGARFPRRPFPRLTPNTGASAGDSRRPNAPGAGNLPWLRESSRLKPPAMSLTSTSLTAVIQRPMRSPSSQMPTAMARKGSPSSPPSKRPSPQRTRLNMRSWKRRLNTAWRNRHANRRGDAVAAGDVDGPDPISRLRRRRGDPTNRRRQRRLRNRAILQSPTRYNSALWV